MHQEVHFYLHQVGFYDAKGPPVPIPNTVVKLRGADNTRWATAREDRTKPTQESETKRVSGCDAEGPPVPIPNTVVKLCGADNTRWATAREDRSLLTFVSLFNICLLSSVG